MIGWGASAWGAGSWGAFTEPERSPWPARGLGWIIVQHYKRPKLEALLAMLLNGVQDLEDALEEMELGTHISRAMGAQLDSIGVWLRLPRDPLTMSDPDYRRLLRAKALANVSRGTGPEMIAILEAVLAGTSTHHLTTPAPATLIQTVDGTLDMALGENAGRILAAGKASGIRTVLEFQPPGALFGWTTSVYAGGVVGWADGPTSPVGSWARAVDGGLS